MAFKSFIEIAKERKRTKRKPILKPKSLLSITQKSYEDKNRRTLLTIRISAEAMKQSRIQIGDRVDIAHDVKTNQWQISVLTTDPNSNTGYKISGKKTSKTSSVRFSIYKGMKTIADPTLPSSVRILSNDQNVRCSTGKIIFTLDENTKVVTLDKIKKNSPLNLI